MHERLVALAEFYKGGGSLLCKIKIKNTAGKATNQFSIFLAVLHASV